jgi:hypothetical protein
MPSYIEDYTGQGEIRSPSRLRVDQIQGSQVVGLVTSHLSSKFWSEKFLVDRDDLLLEKRRDAFGHIDRRCLLIA